MRLFREKTLDRFLQHNTSSFQIESYSSSLGSSPFFFQLSYLERRFVPKHNPHIFRVQRVFQNLRSICDLPKETGEDQRMQSGGIVGIKKASENKTPRSLLVAGVWRVQVHQVNQTWRVFCYSCTPTYSLIDRFQLGGSQRDFLPSSSVSFSKTRLVFILCLHSLLLLFVHYIFGLLFMFMHQSSSGLLLFIYSYSILR